MTSRQIARRFLLSAAAFAALTLTACGEKGERHEGEGKEREHEEESHEAPKATGKVITVNVTTDEKGNYFSPAEIEAKEGDVLRFTLVTGVHNVHFLADSNPVKTNLPVGPSEFLQLPGQTWDLAVKMPAGKYYFQCDPHALLGMKGHVIVE